MDLKISVKGRSEILSPITSDRWWYPPPTPHKVRLPLELSLPFGLARSFQLGSSILLFDRNSPFCFFSDNSLCFVHEISHFLVFPKSCHYSLTPSPHFSLLYNPTFFIVFLLFFFQYAALPTPESRDWKKIVALAALFAGWYLANIYFNM